jgi:Leucine-rich repeat (LRR) protein
MKKLLLLLFIGIVGIGNAQNVNIPDANFKAYLVGNTSINTNGDAEIQVSEAISFNDSIICNSLSLSDLTGIEAFTALTYLYCYDNKLTSLDVTKNTALTKLYCNNNQLTSLDVTKNTALDELGCSKNKLASLDVTKNKALTGLDCGGNKLTSLDVTKNTALTKLYCNNNPLTCVVGVPAGCDLYGAVICP